MGAQILNITAIFSALIFLKGRCLQGSHSSTFFDSINYQFLRLRVERGAQIELLYHLIDIGDGHELDFALEFFAGFHVFRGEDDGFEARFNALVHAFFGVGDGADFPRKPDFAEYGGIFVDGNVGGGAGEGGADGEIDGRFGEFDAAHGVDVDVRGIEGNPAAFFEHGNQHNQFIVVNAERHSPREAVGSFCNERLNFDVHAAVAAFRRGDAGACGDAAAFGEKQLGVIGEAFDARFGHFEYAHFLYGAEPVFDGAEELEIFFLLSLEIEDGVHDMFEDFWSREGALLGDVADDEEGDSAGFGDSHEPCGALSDLSDAACGGGERFGIDGLNGVDDDEFRVREVVFYVFEAGFVEEQKVIGIDSQPFAAHFHLRAALFCGDI